MQEETAEQSTKHVIGIDASNITAGGGVTHIVQLLMHADSVIGSNSIVIVGFKNILDHIPDRPWLVKKNLSDSLKNRFRLLVWKKRRFKKLLVSMNVDILFLPGATSNSGFYPYVSMSQNMLPFERRERLRFFPSLQFFRYCILELTQSRSFKRANGVVFLSEYAKKEIGSRLGLADAQTKIIPHGISKQFFSCREANSEPSKPFHWLYVSTINHYKHQIELVNAAALLVEKGYRFKLTLAGPFLQPAKKEFDQALSAIGEAANSIEYIGGVPYASLPDLYGSADAFVFPSSCENMPNIMLEAMANGLPIASSNLGPMPEMLKDAGIYFDPNSPSEIAQSMIQIMNNFKEAQQRAGKAALYAKDYTWNQSAEQTLEFLIQHVE